MLLRRSINLLKRKFSQTMVWKASKNDLENTLDPISLRLKNCACLLLKDKKNHCKKYAKVWKAVKKN